MSLKLPEHCMIEKSVVQNVNGTMMGLLSPMSVTLKIQGVCKHTSSENINFGA